MFPRILIESHCLKLVISNLLHLISDISAAASWIMQTGGPLIVSVIKTKLIADDLNVTRKQDVGGFTLTWFRYHCQIMIRSHSCLRCCLFCGCDFNLWVEHVARFNGGTWCGLLVDCILHRAPWWYNAQWWHTHTNTVHTLVHTHSKNRAKLVWFIILVVSCNLFHFYWSYLMHFD